MQKILYVLGLLDDADIDWIASAGQRLTFKPKDVLVDEGVHSNRLAIILDGAVAVVANGQYLAQRGPGEVIGELSLLDSRPPSATVKVVEETTALLIDFDDLNAKLERDPGFASRFYKALGVFLAQRMRSLMMAGQTDPDQEEPDEIDPELLDSITLSGARFRWLMDKLGEAA